MQEQMHRSYDSGEGRALAALLKLGAQICKVRFAATGCGKWMINHEYLDNQLEKTPTAYLV